MNRLVVSVIFVILVVGCRDSAANTSRAKAIPPFEKANEIRAGRQEEAIALYTKAIEADPQFAEAYLNRGLSYAEIYDFDRAEADLAKVKHLGIDSKKLEEAIGIAKNLENLDRIREYFKSDFYTVTLRPGPSFDPTAELELGEGSGHGFTLSWLRFRPLQDRVDVLSIKLVQGRQPYRSKWPPDRAPVAVQRGQVTPKEYGVLLRDFALVNSARVTLVERSGFTSSSNSFWVSARLTANKKTLVDMDWAGYLGSGTSEFARPVAAVDLTRDALKNVAFKEQNLTEEERSWASTKFAREWRDAKDWWVQERFIIIVGVVGNASALPALQEVLRGNPKDRSVYYAINAVTRLTNKDLRDHPVEEMDAEKTRRRVLDFLQQKK